MGLGVSPAGEAVQLSAPLPLAAGGDHFGLDVQELGATLHLRLTGAFDLACVGRVEAALERVSDDHTEQVVFDLRELRTLDCAGLHTILRANQRARAAGFDLVVVRPRGLANRVFTLTRVGEKLKLVDRPHQALPPERTGRSKARSPLRSGSR